MGLSRVLELLPFVDNPSASPDCRCSHLSQAHHHYRSGSDCALCGCRRFRRARAEYKLVAPPLRHPHRRPALTAACAVERTGVA